MNEQAHIIAIYGGAFDPIHLGHIKIALQVLAQPEVSELRLLPCYQHPDKSETYATAEHRYNMLKLISKNAITIDRCELNRKGISYTVDTAKHMRETLDKTPIALVLGADTYATINDWHRATQLSSLLHLIVVARPDVKINNNDSNWQKTDSLQEMAHHLSGMVFFMSEPLVDISSSQIRSLIAQGEQPRYLLPGVVWNYIKRNQLYGYKERL